MGQAARSLMSCLKETYIVDNALLSQTVLREGAVMTKEAKPLIAFGTLGLVWCFVRVLLLYINLISCNVNKGTFYCSFSICAQTSPEKKLCESFGERVHGNYCARLDASVGVMSFSLSRDCSLP